jgi:hypothetical protein
MSIDISESKKNNLVRPAPNWVDVLPSLRAVSSMGRKPACRPMVWKLARNAFASQIILGKFQRPKFKIPNK